MNDRWKELNEEAGNYALSKVNSAGYCFETNMYIGQLVRMKLAELIIRECINQCDDITSTRNIEEHFGIEL